MKLNNKRLCPVCNRDSFVKLLSIILNELYEDKYRETPKVLFENISLLRLLSPKQLLKSTMQMREHIDETDTTRLFDLTAKELADRVDTVKFIFCNFDKTQELQDNLDKISQSDEVLFVLL